MQRVVGFLLEQGADAVAVDPGGEIELPATKQVIASRLNLTPETLSRVFHALSGAGLITVSGKQVTIHDIRRLRDHQL
jgi:CRP-like cAMP-binding protein